MGYVRLVKSRAYYKRFQVKMRRRRQNKTNYHRRRRLITQDKRKYNAPKWRYVVRITNKDVVCQVVSAKIIGDHVIAAAYSHELPRYGLKVGLTNYSACYCTGLLLARRLLQKLNLDKFYPGKKKLDGNKFLSHVSNVKWAPGQSIMRPFKCLLDVGLARTVTGAKIFGALKGAVDGGLDIPHSQKRFPGYTRGTGDEEDKYDPQVHADKIYGGHVRNYMKKLMEESPEKYNAHFSQYIKHKIGPDDLEALYRKVHRAIRKDPKQEKKVKKISKEEMEANASKFIPKQKKISSAERKERRLAKIQARLRELEEKVDQDVVMEEKTDV